MPKGVSAAPVGYPTVHAITQPAKCPTEQRLGWLGWLISLSLFFPKEKIERENE
jgi:hypothetical protein